MTTRTLRLPHIASRLFGQPLLMHPGKLATIVNVMAPRLGLEALGAVDDPVPPHAAAASVMGAGGGHVSASPVIAVIDVHGSLVDRSHGLDTLSGLRSYGEIAADLRSALADATVQAILLDVDSGGGEATGVFDLVDEIYASRGKKPIWGVANAAAFSAAYAILSATDRIFMPRVAGVGSVGVVAIHLDQSGSDELQGYEYSPVFKGAKKLDFWSHRPLSKSARADEQAEVDRIYELFVETVARNRDLPVDEVRATEAGCFGPEQAIALGLADQVATLEETIQLLSAEIAPAANTRGARATSRPTANRSDTMAIRKAGVTPAADDSEAEKLRAAEAASAAASDKDEDEDEDEGDGKGPKGKGKGKGGKAPAAPAASAESGAVALAATLPAASSDAVAIMELCQLAGQPLKVATAMVQRGLSVDDARRELMKSRDAGLSAQGEIDPHHAPQPAGAAAASSWDRAFARAQGKKPA